MEKVLLTESQPKSQVEGSMTASTELRTFTDELNRSFPFSQAQSHQRPGNLDLDSQLLYAAPRRDGIPGSQGTPDLASYLLGCVFLPPEMCFQHLVEQGKHSLALHMPPVQATCATPEWQGRTQTHTN